MIKLIVGTKGSGKTKAMIDQINDAVKTSKGNVVVVEKGMKLTYDIAPAARLIDLDEYKISGGEMLYGFVAGLMASNYDITDLYIDGILKVLDHDINRLGVVLDEMAAIAGDSVKVTVTVSADEAALPHDVKKPAQDLFIDPLEGNFDGLNFLANQNMSIVNRKAMEGTILAHTDGGVPEVLVEVDDLSAYNVGYLIYFFWRACACSGYLLGVNPFNQPGVESYKKNMFALLGKPGYEGLTAELEAKLK